MITVTAHQGSEEWKAARKVPRTYTASEASAMMGESKHTTRGELLFMKKTGIEKEIDAHTQARFDEGHRVEAAIRPFVAGSIGASLSPTTGYIELRGMRLLASFDGYDMVNDVVWENKLLNASIVSDMRSGRLNPHYVWQLEQQLLVSGAEKAYFTTSDGTPENTAGVWYESDPALRARLIAGWEQFEADLATYEPAEKAAPTVAAPVEALPALFVQASGSIAISDNLELFGRALTDFVENKLIRSPETDQDFADLESQIKALKRAEEALDAAEAAVLAQVSSVDTMKRMKDALHKLARDNRLMAEKLLKAEKENRKAAIIDRGRQVVQKHIVDLTHRIGGNWLPQANSATFAEAIKGMKSLDSMRDKVDATIAQEKIRLSEIADLIETNLKSLKGEAHDWLFLFPDFAQVCTKSTEDFINLLAIRVGEHEKREQARIEAVRKEEAAKASIKAANEDQRGKADAGVGLEDSGRAQPDAASTPPISAEAKRAAVVEHQDEISAFMASREWHKDANKIRAVLVEFVKFQAKWQMKEAA